MSETITKNDLKAILDEVLLPPLTVESLTATITPTTGTLKGYDLYKYGKVVQLFLRVQKSSTTASGANIFTATFDTEKLRPITTVTSAIFYGAYTITGNFTSAGVINIRNSNASTFNALTGDNLLGICFTYILAS